MSKTVQFVKSTTYLDEEAKGVKTMEEKQKPRKLERSGPGRTGVGKCLIASTVEIKIDLYNKDLEHDEEQYNKAVTKSEKISLTYNVTIVQLDESDEDEDFTAKVAYTSTDRTATPATKVTEELATKITEAAAIDETEGVAN
uniref:Uncharacterized protein n=1 Tax=Arabidopsis halleri subsp. halleri TaxID=81971 RepID=I0J3C1_ARAHH|nr:unknown [Arabidopsis halleri subsp. halleri]